MKKAILFPFLTLLIFCKSAFSQWFPTKGPGGGSVNDIQKFGNRLFIGSGDSDAESIFAGGVFTSDDMGQTWVLRHQGMQNSKVNALLQHNGKIFAGTTSGIFISSDNGNSWAVSNSGLANNRVKCLAVKDNILFAGMDGSGLHKSTDNGLTWTNVFNFTSVNRIFIDGTYLYVLGPGDGAYRRSSDNGVAWTTFGSANGVIGSSSNSMVRRGSELFLSTFEQGLFKSSNNGENWTPIQGDPPGPTWLGVFGDTLWCANNTGQLQYSTDGASTWSIWPEVLQTATPMAGIKTGNSIFLATGKGLFRIDGNNPSQMIAGMANGNIRGLSFNQGWLFAATNTGVFFSNDEGQSWNRSYFNQQDGVYSILNYQGVMLAGTLALGTVKSDDNGATWIRTGFSLPTGRVNGLVQAGSKILAAVRQNGLYKSLDTGKTWTKITAFPTSSTISLCKIPAASGTGEILFSGGNNRTYRSTNEGETWTECILENNTAGGGSSKQLFGVVRMGDTLYGNSTYHLYRSTDEGLNWNIISFPPFVVTNGALFAESNQLMIAGNNNIVIRSSNGGNEWTIDTLQLSSLNGSAFHAMPQTGRITSIQRFGTKNYLSTEGMGLWQFGFVPNQNEETLSGKSEEKLLQISPNPGKEIIQIQLNKPLPAGCILSIYDSRGSCLMKLEAGKLSAETRLDWNAGALPAGLYHYSLRGTSVNESGRILLD